MALAYKRHEYITSSLGWDSTNLKAEKNTILTISFLNHKTNLEEKPIEYSFKAMYPAANVTIKDVKHQWAPTGTGYKLLNCRC